jgi:hypothetical protein
VESDVSGDSIHAMTDVSLANDRFFVRSVMVRICTHSASFSSTTDIRLVKERGLSYGLAPSERTLSLPLLFYVGPPTATGAGDGRLRVSIWPHDVSRYEWFRKFDVNDKVRLRQAGVAVAK